MNNDDNGKPKSPSEEYAAAVAAAKEAIRTAGTEGILGRVKEEHLALNQMRLGQAVSARSFAEEFARGRSLGALDEARRFTGLDPLTGIVDRDQVARSAPQYMREAARIYTKPLPAPIPIRVRFHCVRCGEVLVDQRGSAQRNTDGITVQGSFAPCVKCMQGYDGTPGYWTAKEVTDRRAAFRVITGGNIDAADDSDPTGDDE